MSPLHPYYEAHRAAMEDVMRQRIDFASPLLRDRAGLGDTDPLKREIMEEFEIVLHQMPYVGGAESRMTDFFMRLLGFIAIGRVLRRRGVAPDVIGEIELESYKAQLLTVPEAERFEAGRQFMSQENRAILREQAARSRDEVYSADFVYDFIEPGPGDNFEFGINYRACGFCKFAARHGDGDILSNICGLDYAAYDTRGIKLERTQTLAGGATHCNFRFTSHAPAPTD
jgi:L-2-amino-thiazoline-4-carboxylic acid hydrolase